MTRARLFLLKTLTICLNRRLIGPERFKDLRSYEGIFYAMNLYFIMEDYDSVRYMLGLLKKGYNYGIYKNSIESVERLLEQKKKERL